MGRFHALADELQNLGGQKPPLAHLDTMVDVRLAEGDRLIKRRLRLKGAFFFDGDRR